VLRACAKSSPDVRGQRQPVTQARTRGGRAAHHHVRVAWAVSRPERTITISARAAVGADRADAAPSSKPQGPEAHRRPRARVLACRARHHRGEDGGGCRALPVDGIPEIPPIRDADCGRTLPGAAGCDELPDPVVRGRRLASARSAPTARAGRNRDRPLWRETAQAIRDMVVRGAPAIGCAAAYGLALATTSGEELRAGTEHAARFPPHCRQSALGGRASLGCPAAHVRDVEGRGGPVARGGPRRLQGDRTPRRGAGPRWQGDPHSLQRGRAGNRRVRNCPWRGPGGARGGKEVRRLRRRDAAVVAGRPPDCLGAPADGIPVHDPARRRRGVAAGKRQGRMRGGRRRPDRAHGDTANKIGTYPWRSPPRRLRCPFFVAAPTSTIDLRAQSGGDIPIEERPPAEVTHLAGSRVAADGVQVFNPAFDVTPARYISAIVTERGVARAPYERSVPALAPGRKTCPKRDSLTLAPGPARSRVPFRARRRDPPCLPGRSKPESEEISDVTQWSGQAENSTASRKATS